MKYSFVLLFTFLGSNAISQYFKVGVIDVYGNRKVPTGRIDSAFIIKEGDSVSESGFKPAQVEANLKRVPGVRYASVSPICCDSAGALLFYIGIGESDDVILTYRKKPGKDIKLPPEMMMTYHETGDLIQEAIRNNGGVEDDSEGYALLTYEPARQLQLKNKGFAAASMPLLVDVLQHAKDPEQRAAAADIIAYGTERQKVVGYLLYAVDDPDEGVRNNATRALGILAGYSNAHPELKIVIPAAPFIRMLNSIVWTDRNKGSSVVMQLSQGRDPALFNQIKAQALPAIIEMARWKDRNHAFFCFLILGRMAGMDDQYLFGKNNAPDYNTVVDAMIAALAAKQ